MAKSTALGLASDVSLAEAPRVLLVMHDETFVNVLRTHLESNGWSVLSVARGRDALRIVQSEVPNAVVADLEIDEIDGLELALELMLMPQRPFVIVCAHDFSESALDTHTRDALGIHVLLQRPFRLQALSDALAPAKLTQSRTSGLFWKP